MRDWKEFKDSDMSAKDKRTLERIARVTRLEKENAELTAKLEKLEAERDGLVSEAYYQGLKAGLFVTPPERPKGESATVCAINHFEHRLDRHCDGLARQYVEQLRKELEK